MATRSRVSTSLCEVLDLDPELAEVSPVRSSHPLLRQVRDQGSARRRSEPRQRISSSRFVDLAIVGATRSS